MLFSVKSNSQSPGNGTSETLNFKNFLGPLALAFSSRIKKSFLRHCNPNPILLTDFTRQRGGGWAGRGGVLFFRIHVKGVIEFFCYEGGGAGHFV
jgi:hypothetical protein